MKALPGKYARDCQGELWLIEAETAPSSMKGGIEEDKGEANESSSLPSIPDHVAGCIALRKSGKDADETAEMKRMFVRPAFRGNRLGFAMTRFIADRAHAMGYGTMVLDSLERLPGAIRTYERAGFQRCDAYIFNPMKDAVYMRAKLPLELGVHAGASKTMPEKTASPAPL